MSDKPYDSPESMMDWLNEQEQSQQEKEKKQERKRIQTAMENAAPVKSDRQLEYEEALERNRIAKELYEITKNDTSDPLYHRAVQSVETTTAELESFGNPAFLSDDPVEAMEDSLLKLEDVRSEVKRLRREGKERQAQKLYSEVQLPLEIRSVEAADEQNRRAAIATEQEWTRNAIESRARKIADDTMKQIDTELIARLEAESKRISRVPEMRDQYNNLRYALSTARFNADKPGPQRPEWVKAYNEARGSTE